MLLLLLPDAVFAADGDASIESVVIFNTICAKCHEAECSGRLSFDKALERSASHVRRHYAQAAEKKWLQGKLFSILNYMKEKCAYYPMKVPVPLNRVWSGDILDRFATLMEKNYFIPVGEFSPGNYQMELGLKNDAKVNIHLISEEFEMVVEDCRLTRNRRISISFAIEQTGNFYFRMYPRDPVKIIGLAISRIGRDVQAPIP